MPRTGHPVRNDVCGRLLTGGNILSCSAPVLIPETHALEGITHIVQSPAVPIVGIMFEVVVDAKIGGMVARRTGQGRHPFQRWQIAVVSTLLIDQFDHT